MKIVYEIGNSQTWQYNFGVILRGHNRPLQGKIQLGLIFWIETKYTSVPLVRKDGFLGHRDWLLKSKIFKTWSMTEMFFWSRYDKSLISLDISNIFRVYPSVMEKWLIRDRYSSQGKKRLRLLIAVKTEQPLTSLFIQELQQRVCAGGRLWHPLGRPLWGL